MAANSTLSRKRKRPSEEKPTLSGTTPQVAPGASILQLEQQIQESQKHYNNIAALLKFANGEIQNRSADFPAILSLCRVFCRLYADGKFSKPKGLSDKERLVLDWLQERLIEYQNVLVNLLRSSHDSNQNVAVTVSMHLVKEEIMNAESTAKSSWKNGFFRTVVFVMLEGTQMDAACRNFVENFCQIYDDVRHYTFIHIASILADSAEASAKPRPNMVANSLLIMSGIDVPDEQKSKLRRMFCEELENQKQEIIPLSAHKKQAQKAWLALLGAGLGKEQRKTVLRTMTQRVVPWFQNVELLMDFLTDSYNEGGASSLLALSGLFSLMQEKNLDYPDFYKKLYSLLDDNLLHSKYRSRFFRLLNTFLSSTHLPAALVASFIKRLSRLALFGPPAGVIAVVPWVYNMLKTHPTCTFMIHREPRTDDEQQDVEEYGADDPFDMEEPDPMHTAALESCLWELETLRSHYHPNVASLARIISEQFTKSSYNLEDFLDHSYNSLIDAELSRDLKNPPVVEFEIPKRIFVRSDGDDTLQKLLEQALISK